MKKPFSVFLLLCCAFAIQHANAQQFEPKWSGTVCALKIETDTIAIPLEKANVKVKTAASAGMILTGIGKVRKKYVIEGNQSTTQLNPYQPIVLIVKCKDNESEPYSFIRIVKFEEKKKERKAELANLNWLGKSSEGNMELIPYEAEVYGKSSYILTFTPPLGEFGVIIRNPNELDEKITIFHCFGVHENQ